MSKVSRHAEHLIRAALMGIEQHPETWDQSDWVSRHPCGTKYCIGGWMMLYDGWKHERANHVNVWTKGDRTTVYPFQGFLRGLVYEGSEAEESDDTIFADAFADFDELLAYIEDTLEIDFTSGCPCLAESGICNLSGCPCGTHRDAAVNVEAFEDGILDAVLKLAADTYVKLCRQAGEEITVAQVLADAHLVSTFRAVFQSGAHSTVKEVTEKANRKIAEINHELQAARNQRDDLIGEIRHIQQSSVSDLRDNEIKILRAEVRRLNDEIAESAQPLTASWERDLVIRGLQGQVDDLRDGTRRTPEFRKMKAALQKAEFDVAQMSEGQKVRAAQIRKLQDEIAQKDRLIKGFGQGDPTKLRQEGFRRAVESWQKALDIIKAQENL